MNTKLLDKNDIDIVIYSENLKDFGEAFIVWYYYYICFDKTRANTIQFMSNNDIITVMHKLSSKNVILLGEADCVSKICNVSNKFMKTDNVAHTWKYFFPNVDMPNLFNQMNNDDFTSAFSDKMFDFNEWLLLLKNNELIDICITNEKKISETKQQIITEAMNDVIHIVQDVNNIYMYIVYVESEFFKSEICSQLSVKYSVGDIFVVYNYDVNKNTTTYCIKSVNNDKIAKHNDGIVLNNACWLKKNGKYDFLPYRTINDFDLLRKIRNKSIGVVAIKSEKYDYVLMKVAEIREEWTENDFFAFLKRKNNDFSLIVFEKPSDSIEYDNEKHTMIDLKDYVIMHNDLFACNGLSKLEFNLCNNEYLLCITSDKEFADIFQNS